MLVTFISPLQACIVLKEFKIRNCTLRHFIFSCQSPFFLCVCVCVCMFVVEYVQNAYSNSAENKDSDSDPVVVYHFSKICL